MKNLVLISIFMICNLFCYSQTKFENKKIGHVYSIDVPDYMLPTKDLNDNASAQYQSSVKSAYVIVLDESKDDHKLLGIKYSLKEYYDDLMEGFTKGLKDVNIAKPMIFSDRGYNFYQIQMSANFEGQDLSYLITCVESNNYFYRIICWTIKDNKSKLINDFIRISTSLKD